MFPSINITQKQKWAKFPRTPVVVFLVQAENRNGNPSKQTGVISYEEEKINEHLGTFVCGADIWRSSLAS